MSAQGLVATQPDHTQRQQRDRQYEGEHADNNPDIDQTDAHPCWIGGRASPLPAPNLVRRMGDLRARGRLKAMKTERPERRDHAGANEKLRGISQGRQCVAVSSLGSKTEDHLTHLDAVAISQDDGPMIGIEWLTVHAGRVRGRQVRKAPALVLQRHLRVQPADRGFVELNVPVRRAVLPAKGDLGLRRSWLSNKPDFLADFPAFDDLETARQELERPVHGPRDAPRFVGRR